MEDEIRKNDSGSGIILAWTLVAVLTILLIIAVIVIYFLYSQQSSQPQNPSPPPVGIKTYSTPTPVSQIIKLDKQYAFPIYDGSNTKVGEIGFIIKDIERTKEVMIAGQKATAVGDRELVILNLELTNSGNLAAQVFARNYLRLKVNGTDKLIAPEFHSDPVDLQPQSTKDIRMGFSIAQTDKNLILQIGELNGPKDSVALD